MRDEIKLRLSGQIVSLEKAYSKVVYKELRNRIVTTPTAKLKINAHFVNDTLNMLEKNYSLPYRVALDTKTSEFQYVITKQMPCDKYLLTQNWYCSPYVVNRMNPSNIFSCHYTKNFWSEVIKWLVDHQVKIENLSDKDTRFGVMDVRTRYL